MSPQDALWTIPNGFGATWWIVCSALAAPAALIMFVTMVMRHPFSALLVARVLIVGSLVCFAAIPLNSGWLPWGVLLASAGGLMAAILIATGWCEREDQSLTIAAALGRWVRDLVKPPCDKTKGMVR